MPHNVHVIRIDFPALDNLVAYLRESQQGMIDALTASVVDVAARLDHSTDGLSSAVKEEQQ